MKTFSKYFSLFLILILIHSNFSFAITQMLCKMAKNQTACECQNPCASELQITSEESQCCKIFKKEINNKNILESNKFSFTKNIIFQITDAIPAVKLISQLSKNNMSRNCHFNPPADIPILFSHILI